MTLFEKHIALVDRVNESKTELDHRLNEYYLRGWRKGIEDTRIEMSYTSVDLHYINKGIDRPMCCGVFLDWKPENGKAKS